MLDVTIDVTIAVEVWYSHSSRTSFLIYFVYLTVEQERVSMAMCSYRKHLESEMASQRAWCWWSHCCHIMMSTRPSSTAKWMCFHESATSTSSGYSVFAARWNLCFWLPSTVNG